MIKLSLLIGGDVLVDDFADLFNPAMNTDAYLIKIDELINSIVTDLLIMSPVT